MGYLTPPGMMGWGFPLGFPHRPLLGRLEEPLRCETEGGVDPRSNQKRPPIDGLSAGFCWPWSCMENSPICSIPKSIYVCRFLQNKTSKRVLFHCFVI